VDKIQAALQVNFEKQQKIMLELNEKYPDLPFVTTLVMAGDIASRDIADRFVSEGMPAIEAAKYIGSYARLDWLIEQYEKGNLPDNWLLNDFPSEWSSCDPDDTDPKYHALWAMAYGMNGCSTILDGSHYPWTSIPVYEIEVYRGQLKASDPLGIAWTTDREVAEKFAHGAGLRVPVSGVVLTRRIKVCDVYGYLTGRGESEVVLDPYKLIR